MKRSVVALAILASVLAIGFPAHAQSTFPREVEFVEDVVFDKLPPTTAIAFAPDNRIFIALKDGIVRVAVNGSLLPTPFIDISAMTNRNTDRGLLAVAPDPQFPTRPYVYLYFVYDPPGFTADTKEPRLTRLVRVKADPAQGFNVALPNTMEVILGKNSVGENIAQPFVAGVVPEPASCMTGKTTDGTPIEDCLPVDGQSHSAGALVFAPDGSLFVSHGDGSNYDTANKPALRSQNLDSLAGKLLHIDPNTGAGLADNPFFDPAKPFSNRSKVWAYGLRNPFRLTLNPSNGQAFIADVGSSSWEEINSEKGGNFGWPCYEGGVVPGGGTEGGNTTSLPNSGYSNFSRTREFCQALYANPSAVSPPEYSYAHPYANGKDLGASVTGVAFYSGTIYPPEYQGALFFGDYAMRNIRYLTFDGQGVPTAHLFATEIASSKSGVVQLLPGPDTNIYGVFLDLSTKTSQVRRFRYTGIENAAPIVVIKADPRAGNIPLTVNFRSDGTVDPDGQPLSYRWSFGDGTTSTDPNPTHVYQTVGTFEAVLTVREATPPSAESSAKIVIRTGVTPPKAFIDSPSTGTTYRIGEPISFSGHAEFNDPNARAALTWSILQHHNDHEHLVDEITGSNGTFEPAEHSDNTYYDLCLFADAGDALQDQKCLAIMPQTTDVTLASEPVGAPITYVDESVDVLAPAVIRPIVNSKQTIVASPIHAGRTFSEWSDGVKSPERTFTAGVSPQTFTAKYVNTPPQVKVLTSSFLGTAPLTVKFDASGSADPEGGALTYSWKIGAGKPLAGPLVKKRFKTPGTYRVRLTVSDALGVKQVQRLVIRVISKKVKKAVRR